MKRLKPREPGGSPRAIELDDDYEIVSELGRGGSAIVYLARERELGREVAIKVVRSTEQDDEAIGRLSREARIVAMLRHPNIVTLFSTRRLADGGLALIMQYVPGRTLKGAILESGPLPIATVETVLREMGSALAYAHRYSIIHRDIKPENIYLDDEHRRAMLSDFGIARVGEIDSTLTLAGVTLGTPAYMSPEQIDGEVLDGRSDLYSLGLVAYQMLSGHQPWAGSNLYKILDRQKHEELPPLHTLRNDIPRSLERAVDGLLRKNRADRWSDAAQFLSQLRPGVTEDPPLPLLPEPEAASQPRPWRSTMEETPTLRFFLEVPQNAGASPSDEGADAGADEAIASADAGADEAIASADAGADEAIASADAGADEAIASPATTTPVSVTPPVRVPLTTPHESGMALPVHVPVGRARPTVRRAATAMRAIDQQTRIRRRLVAGIALLLLLGGSAIAPGMIGRDDASPGDRSARTVEAATLSLPQVPGDTSDRSNDPAEQEIRSLSRIVPVTGDDQQATVGTLLPASIAVRVENADGHPVSGVGVEFRVVSGEGAVAPAVAVTDSAGVAAAEWIVGLSAGPNRVVSVISGVPEAQASFSATALAGPPAQITAVGDIDEQPSPGAALPVSVRVDDEYGNPVHRASVEFRTAAGDGSVRPATATDASGLARTTWTLGRSAAENRLTATVAGSDIRTEWTVRSRRSLAARVDLALGGTHTCGMNAAGRVYCWGGNDNGQLGVGTVDRESGSVQVRAPAPLARIGTGLSHTCALDHDGSALCWGVNESGQLGTGDWNRRNLPAPVQGGISFVTIEAGLSHTCALDESGAAYCWGAGRTGQLGDGAASDRTSPVPVLGGHAFTALTAGWSHTCALTSQRLAYCWGSNREGQIGDGTNTDRLAPTRVAGGYSFAAISVGASHSCGITTGDEAYCWGQNSQGQLGDGGSAAGQRPVRVQAPVAFTSIVTGAVHSCGLSRVGEAYCWGRNNFGQLGDGSTVDSPIPVRVAGVVRFSSLRAGGSHTCARTASAETYCWGYNVDGQIGDVTRTNRTEPVRISWTRN